MAINDDFLHELLARVSIEQVVSPYVTLRRRGQTMTGLCPFHNEKTPSFTIYTDNNSFYCFGCGAGGNTITFLRRIENLDYVEAVKSLAEKAGMAMPENAYDDSLNRRRMRVLEANREAARFFHDCLFSDRGKLCLDYYLGRGFTTATIKHFGLGVAPDSWDSLLHHMKQKGFSETELEDANLALRSKNKGTFYDSFRNRAMIPIIDLRGNVIAFGGRVLDDSKPKYINTSDTLVYKKSKGVFGLNFAKNSKSRSLIVVEGYMDVIALHQAGITNAIACLGTALTREQVGLVCRYADEVVLSYDMDGAGRTATEKAMRLFGETGVKLRVLSYSGGKDPDEIIKKYGAERFRSLVDGAANDIEYRLLNEKDKFEVNTDDGKLAYLKAACAVLAELDNELEREIYATRLSNETGVSKAAVTAQVESLRRKRRRNETKNSFAKIGKSLASSDDKINPERSKSLRAARAEETLISLLINNPDFGKKLHGKLSEELFVTEFNRRVASFILRRIELGQSTELSMFEREFSPDELGRISKIINTGVVRTNTLDECEGCIKVLLDEKNKPDMVNPAAADDSEFANLFEQLKNKKT